VIICEPVTGRKLISVLGDGTMKVHYRDALQACPIECRALVRFLMSLPRRRTYSETDIGSRAENKMRREITKLEKENAELMATICRLNETVECLTDR